MSYKLIITQRFKSELKKLTKKYPSLIEEMGILGLSLKEQPLQGNSLGGNSYKIRIAIKSKGKGKRGGGRIITHIKVMKETIYLLSIYSKGDQEDISDQELAELIAQISDEE